MDLDLELQLQYEHIDWNDIMDAEMSGDQESLELLRSRSMELKRSNSLPSTSPTPSPSPTPPPAHSPHHHNSPSPDQTLFHRPRKPRRPLGPKSLNFQRNNRPTRPSYRRSQSAQENVRNFLDDIDESFPPLFKTISGQEENAQPPIPSSPSQGLSYAQAMGQSRTSKRTISERNCFSPTDLSAKRSAIYGEVVTPTALKQGSKLALTEDEGGTLPFSTQSCEREDELYSTPREADSEDMDTATPENSRLVRAGPAQRRLFPAPTPEKPSTQQPPSGESEEKLTDPHRLAKRETQLEYGKKTIGYERYIQAIPKWKRRRGHPMTPDKYDPCSTRSWQGRIKVWRRSLHDWDPPSSTPSEAVTGTKESAVFTTEEAGLCNIDLSNEVGSQE